MRRPVFKWLQMPSQTFPAVLLPQGRLEKVKKEEVECLAYVLVSSTPVTLSPKGLIIMMGSKDLDLPSHTLTELSYPPDIMVSSIGP